MFLVTKPQLMKLQLNQNKPTSVFTASMHWITGHQKEILPYVEIRERTFSSSNPPLPPFPSYRLFPPCLLKFICFKMLSTRPPLISLPFPSFPYSPQSQLQTTILVIIIMPLTIYSLIMVLEIQSLGYPLHIYIYISLHPLHLCTIKAGD